MYSKEEIQTRLQIQCHICTHFSVLTTTVWSSDRAFSIECRKTTTKVITLTNHSSHKQSNEPIRVQSKHMKVPPSAGKRVWAGLDWFWYYFWLVNKVVQDIFIQSQSVAIQNQSNCEITFNTQLKTALIINVKTCIRVSQQSTHVQF